MVPIQETVHNLMTQAGLPNFPLDKDGFPAPGAVIRHFREQMKYIDPPADKEKRWTQVDLAKRLRISEVSIRLMETQNKGLDSIGRRRVLADILKIPPVLLGLGSLADLMEFLNHHQIVGKTPISTSTAVKSGTVKNETINLYQHAFLIYSEMHSTSTAQDAIFDIEQWIDRVKTDLAKAQTSQQPMLQRTLWNFHALSAKIYSDDLRQWGPSFDHLNAALELAQMLDSSDLKAASLYRSGQIRFAQRNFVLAKRDLDGAVIYAKDARPSMQGAVFAAAGLAHSLTASDTASIISAQRLLDQAEHYTESSDVADEYIIKFNTGKYLLEKADALITLGRPAKALGILDGVEDELDPTQKRRLAYLNILRAEAYMKLKRPELDTSLLLLSDAFDVSKTIKSEFNIGYIRRMYKILAASSYGTSPTVADLGMKLREWRNVK
ncbi:MAG: helix-turn-helix domain-containing protein [Ktedonobacteraceae bacterium]